MNSADGVDKKIETWKKKGYSKAELAALIAEACLGWPYIYGARGQLCTQSYRESRANSVGGAEGNQIIKTCKGLSKKTSCDGCKWYPNESRVRSYDCRGFTYWVLHQVGIEIKGAGATSQWNTASNWKEKGDIKNLPSQGIAVVFWRDKKKPGVMAHTGLYLGDGVIIHCSGEVKVGKPTDKGWTDYAIPNGLDGEVWRSMLKKGSTGDDVKYLQELLNKQGYKLTVDGKFGSKTQSAVKAFQKANKLNPDGIVGPLTWDALENQDDKKYMVIIRNLTKNIAEVIIAEFGGEMKEE